MFERAKAAFFLVNVLVLSACAGETYLKTPDSTRPGRGFSTLISGCPSGERVCINKCRQVVDDVGEPCTVDPCAPNSEGVCGQLLDCVPNEGDPTLGTCQVATPLLCHATQPRSGDNRCAAGLFCSHFDICQERPSPSRTHDGSCVLPTREGQPCDETCRRCEPGTSCKPRLPGELSICRRLCTDDGDCVDPDRCLPTVGWRLTTDRFGNLRREPVARFCVPCSPTGMRPPEGGACCPGTRLDEAGFCQIPSSEEAELGPLGEMPDPSEVASCSYSTIPVRCTWTNDRGGPEHDCYEIPVARVQGSFGQVDLRAGCKSERRRVSVSCAPPYTNAGPVDPANFCYFNAEWPNSYRDSHLSCVRNDAPCE